MEPADGGIGGMLRVQQHAAAPVPHARVVVAEVLRVRVGGQAGGDQQQRLVPGRGDRPVHVQIRAVQQIFVDGQRQAVLFRLTAQLNQQALGLAAGLCSGEEMRQQRGLAEGEGQSAQRQRRRQRDGRDGARAPAPSAPGQRRQRLAHAPVEGIRRGRIGASEFVVHGSAFLLQLAL